MTFQLGQLVATPGAINALQKTGETPLPYLNRHLAGNWGDCDDQDAKANDDALANGGRIFSVYHLTDGIKIWVITEADRSSTCVLLPSEY
jgi:hypothetical protein